jgi:hypothetical protein
LDLFFLNVALGNNNLGGTNITKERELSAATLAKHRSYLWVPVLVLVEKLSDPSSRVLTALRGQDVAISTYAVAGTLRLPRYDGSPDSEPSPLAKTLRGTFSTNLYTV